MSTPLRVGTYARASTSGRDQNPETQMLPLREFVASQGFWSRASLSTTLQRPISAGSEYDNALAEAFFGTLETELLRPHRFIDCGPRALRLHRGLVQPAPAALHLGYLSPAEFERRWWQSLRPKWSAQRGPWDRSRSILGDRVGSGYPPAKRGCGYARPAERRTSEPVTGLALVKDQWRLSSAY